MRGIKCKSMILVTGYLCFRDYHRARTNVGVRFKVVDLNKNKKYISV